MCPKCVKSRKPAKNNDLNIEASELSPDEKNLLTLFRLNPRRVLLDLEVISGQTLAKMILRFIPLDQRPAFLAMIRSLPPEQAKEVILDHLLQERERRRLQ